MSSEHIFVFAPSRFSSNTKPIYGFDIETYDHNKRFYCASLHDGAHVETFFNKGDIISFLKQKRFRNSIIAASNLGFDYFGTFFGEEEEKHFNLLFRGSHLLYAKTYMEGNGFRRRGKNPLIFLDTMNYASISVEKLGKLIGEPKLGKPVALGRRKI